jgi:hypothetical protein
MGREGVVNAVLIVGKPTLLFPVKVFFFLTSARYTKKKKLDYAWLPRFIIFFFQQPNGLSVLHPAIVSDLQVGWLRSGSLKAGNK